MPSPSVDERVPFIDLSPKARQLIATVLASLLILLGGGSWWQSGDAKSSAEGAEAEASDAAAGVRTNCESNNETRVIVLGSWTLAVSTIRPYITDQAPLDDLIAAQGRLLLPEDCTP